MQTRRDACYCNTFLMKDISATKAGLFKQYICSMATHFAIKFSDPVLSFIPSKKDIRTLPLLEKDVYFQRFKQVNVFVDRSYYGPYYLSLNVFKASHPGFWSGNLFLIAPFPDLCLLVPFSKGSTLYILFYSIFHNNSPLSFTEGIGKPFFHM